MYIRQELGEWREQNPTHLCLGRLERGKRGQNWPLEALESWAETVRLPGLTLCVPLRSWLGRSAVRRWSATSASPAGALRREVRSWCAARGPVAVYEAAKALTFAWP